MDVPAPSPRRRSAKKRSRRPPTRWTSARGLVSPAAAGRRPGPGALAERGIEKAAIDKFGWASRRRSAGVAACGAATEALAAAGLLVEDGRSGAWRDFFRSRVMIPVHDARGRTVGFAGRIHGAGEPKYINSPESDHFTKGDLLFNLHRASPAARARGA
jgi:DNA primase